MNDSIVIIGHGTRSMQGLTECRAFAQAVTERLSRPVHLCFLELVDPNMEKGLSKAAQNADPDGEMCILPLFLGNGDHYKMDVPKALHACQQVYPHLCLRYAKPLGPHPKINSILQDRIDDIYLKAASINQVCASKTAVLIVGRGSSDEESNREIVNLAAFLATTRTWLTVKYAFQAVRQPDIFEGFLHCKKLGAQHIIVVPYLLFAGRLYDAIHNAFTQVAIPSLQVFYTPYLGCEPLDSRLIDVAEQRILQADKWAS